jgi:hypothetical protein
MAWADIYTVDAWKIGFLEEDDVDVLLKALLKNGL